MRPRRPDAKQQTNKYKFICIACRYTAKRPWSKDFQHRCPSCRRALLFVGSKIPVPRKTDDKSWEALAVKKTVRLRQRGTKKASTTL